MTKDDYGVELPISIKGLNFSQNDELRIKIVKWNQTILTKVYTTIDGNVLNFSLTQQESSQLPVGDYEYSLDWYQNNSFMYNIIQRAQFKVVDKL